jgi:uncharacterized surface anchored protein
LTLLVLRYNPGVKFRLALFFFIELFLCLARARAAASGEIRGVVSDARGGEALARVQVRLENTSYQTVTDARGRFAITGIEPGDYVIQASTVGYLLLEEKISLRPG